MARRALKNLVKPIETGEDFAAIVDNSDKILAGMCVCM